MQLLKGANFLNFHLKAFTQRRRVAKVPQRKALRVLCAFAPLRALLIFFLVPARPAYVSAIAEVTQVNKRRRPARTSRGATKEKAKALPPVASK